MSQVWGNAAVPEGSSLFSLGLWSDSWDLGGGDTKNTDSTVPKDGEAQGPSMSLTRPASLSDRVPLLKNYSISTTASQNFAFLLHKDHESHKRGTMRSPPPAAAHTLGHSRTGSSTPSMRAHKSPPTLLPSGSLASGLSLTAPKRSTSCLHGILPISTRLTVISHCQNCPPPPHPSALSQGDAHFTLTSSGSHIPLNPQHTAV